MKGQKNRDDEIQLLTLEELEKLPLPEMTLWKMLKYFGPGILTSLSE